MFKLKMLPDFLKPLDDAAEILRIHRRKKALQRKIQARTVSGHPKYKQPAPRNHKIATNINFMYAKWELSTVAKKSRILDKTAVVGNEIAA